jgi:hypothetical protein
MGSLLSIIPYFRIPSSRASQILSDLKKAVSSWRTIGKELGMQEFELNQFEPAFENPKAWQGIKVK